MTREYQERYAGFSLVVRYTKNTLMQANLWYTLAYKVEIMMKMYRLGSEYIW